ncbi:MAG: DUF3656 domain-containing protein [Lachnospirales bacterium]
MLNNKIELLSPAGTIEIAKAAISKGADAIYIGGKLFSARSSANNFTFDEMEEIFLYAKVRGVKVLLAVNTLIKNKEILELKEYLIEVKKRGIDTLIIQDIGVAKFINDNLKAFTLHASTQLTAHSLKDVLELEKVGFKRVVLARELSLDEIKYIADNCNVEIEVFCHGANCVSFSGQCLMSSYIGGRSGNRGKCAQPCRLAYNIVNDNNDKKASGYVLSPRDTFSIDYIEDLINANVKSLKIEGRMKNITYVSAVTLAYRSKIDSILQGNIFDSDLIKEITQAFNRGGALSKMYFENYSSPKMISLDTPKNTGVIVGEVLSYNRGLAKVKLYEDLCNADGIAIGMGSYETYGTYINKAFKKGNNVEIEITGNIKKGDKVYKTFDKSLDDKYKKFKDVKQILVKCDLEILKDKPMVIKLYLDNIVIEKVGNIPDLAINKSVDIDMIKDKISKTGGTTYKLVFDKIAFDEGLFVSIKELKELRRNALDELDRVFKSTINKEELIIDLPEFKKEVVTDKKLVVEVNSINQLKEVKLFDVHRVVLNLEKVDLYKVIELLQHEAFAFEIFVKLPRISMSIDEKLIEKYIIDIDKSKVSGITVCTYGQLLDVQNISNKPIALDLSFNVFNQLSLDLLRKEKNVNTVCISPELKYTELKSMSSSFGEVIVYGKLPLMITKQCPVGIHIADKNSNRFCMMKNHVETYYLEDNKENKFPIKCNCEFCYATILSDSLVDILKDEKLYKDVYKLNYRFFKVIFTTEDSSVVKEVLSNYEKFISNHDFGNIHIDDKNYSGYFNKGVK